MLDRGHRAGAPGGGCDVSTTGCFHGSWAAADAPAGGVDLRGQRLEPPRGHRGPEPEHRHEQGFTAFLGVAELLGGIGVVVGVLTQLAAAGLILIMLGAIQKKLFVWPTGF
jgi:uncharacterized membrane protein YphA (DoxX/SURF4 family)